MKWDMNLFLTSNAQTNASQAVWRYNIQKLQAIIKRWMYLLQDKLDGNCYTKMYKGHANYAYSLEIK